MILYMLDINTTKKQIYKYLLLSLFFLIFSLIYELFSHGVYSKYMMFAFSIPLILGTLLYLIIFKFKINKRLSYIGMKIYNCFIITLTFGSIMKGFLDIYGTTNKFISIYLIISVFLLLLSIFINIIFNVKKKGGVNMKDNIELKKSMQKRIFEKTIIFIVGILLGSIISAGSFYAYSKSNDCNTNQNTQTNHNMMPQMPNDRPNNKDENDFHQSNQNNNQSNDNNKNNTNSM